MTEDAKAAAAYAPQWVNKIDVATRQLRVAVRLHFEECDPVALHSLVVAAHGVVSDLTRRTNSPSILGKSVYIAANFFKHADRDPEGRVNIEPLWRLTEDLLFDAVKTLQGISEKLPFELKVYWAWFMITRPEEFQNCGPAVDAIMRDNQHLAKMSFGELRQLLRFNQVTDQSEPLPQWALLGPGPLTSESLLTPRPSVLAGERIPQDYGKDAPAENRPAEDRPVEGKSEPATSDARQTPSS